MITASSLPRLLNCPGSAVLPRAETASIWADAGHDEHAELADIKALPPELAKLVPPAAMSEVKLAFDVATREGRVIGDGIGREYGEIGPFEIAGSADVVGVDGDAAVVIDWKTGYLDVEPAATNPQLAFYALAASRALSLDRAIVRIVYTKTGRVDEAELGPLDLAPFGDALEQLFVRVQSLEAAKKRGEQTSTKEGRWCRYCPSKAFCPSKNALLVQLSGRGLTVVGDMTMTADKAADAYREFVRVEQLVKDAKARLTAYVDANGPIDLGNGRMFGRYQRQGDERLDGSVAMRAIREVVGESAKEFESIAIELRTSKAALTRAAKAIGEKPKLATAVVNKIRELGGATRNAPERPVGEFLTSEASPAPPPEFDVDEVNRLLSETT